MFLSDYVAKAIHEDVMRRSERGRLLLEARRPRIARRAGSRTAAVRRLATALIRRASSRISAGL